ncbi:two pore potassium channel protein sup-9-like [Acropora palmata]|uniref:two pore potassium channel protein sup-9-like n=1 Tax=Acropora palmata TaxID=6131 RepID=UPI003DA15A54
MDPLCKTYLIRVLAFLIFGAVVPWLFVLVEDSRENTIEAKYQVLESLHVSMISKYNMTIEEFINFSTSAHDVLSEADPRWGYFVALEFLLQAVTTVGYGNITPRTPVGQLLCIVVSLFGIPLTLLLIKSIGESNVKVINKIVVKFERKFLHRPQPENLQTKSAVILFFIMLFRMMTQGCILMYLEGWTFVEGIYFWFITYTTIGFGDYVPTEYHLDSRNVDIQQFFLNETVNEGNELHPGIIITEVVYTSIFLFDLCVVASVVNSIAAATEEWKKADSLCSLLVMRRNMIRDHRQNRVEILSSSQGETNKAYSGTESFRLQEENTTTNRAIDCEVREENLEQNHLHVTELT